MAFLVHLTEKHETFPWAKEKKRTKKKICQAHCFYLMLSIGCSSLLLTSQLVNVFDCVKLLLKCKVFLGLVILL